MHDLHATGNILFKKRTKTLFSVYTLIKLIKFESLKAIELLCSPHTPVILIDVGLEVLLVLVGGPVLLDGFRRQKGDLTTSAEVPRQTRQTQNLKFG